LREILRLAVVLTSICVGCAFFLTFVRGATKDRIEYQKIKLLVAPAVEAVFPSYDNDPILERIKVKITEEKIVTVFPAKKGGKLIAIGYTGIGTGHGGPVEVMLGLTLEGKILGITVVSHAETPGIGDKPVKSDEFLGQFKGKTLESDIEGEIQAVSGSTETSTAITEGVSNGMKLFSKIKKEIRG